MLVYYHLVFSCRCHGHGDEVVEWRVYNGAYTDELCEKERYTSAFGCCLRRDMDVRMDPAADSHFGHARGNNRIANNVSGWILLLTAQPVEHPLYSS